MVGAQMNSRDNEEINEGATVSQNRSGARMAEERDGRAEARESKCLT